MSHYYLYILECSNHSFYTGITVDPEKRWREHLSGKAAKYTRAFKPIAIKALWKINSDRANAQHIEHLVKTLARKDKIKLIERPDSIYSTLNIKRTLLTPVESITDI